MDFLYFILRLLFCVLVVVAMAFVPYMKLKAYCAERVGNRYLRYLLLGCFGLIFLIILLTVINLIV